MQSSGLPILLIDNYDSYTFNLFHLLYESNNRTAPVVLKNDQIQFSCSELSSCFAAIIISPGPGHPSCENDFSKNSEIITKSDLPILGVCLGHQGIGLCFGARVIQSEEPFHGRTSLIFHSNEKERMEFDDIFEGLPNPFAAVRYHSLKVQIDHELPELKITARTKEGLIMGLQHRRKPIFGVQFHPESICTENGIDLCRNFLKEVKKFHCGINKIYKPLNLFKRSSENKKIAETKSKFRLVIGSIRPNKWQNTEYIFWELFAQKKMGYWLDSSRSDLKNGRFSIMGECDGESRYYFSLKEYLMINSFALSYSINNKQITFYQDNESFKEKLGENKKFLDRFRSLAVNFGYPNQPDLSFLAKSELDKKVLLELGFLGGFVGFLGYEMHEETLERPFYLSKNANEMNKEGSRTDALWYLANRFMIFDHHTRLIFVVCLSTEGKDSIQITQEFSLQLPNFKEAQEIVQQNLEKIRHLTNDQESESYRSFQIYLKENFSVFDTNKAILPKDIEGFIRDPREKYLEKIDRCKELIKRGESYELCLTTKFTVQPTDMKATFSQTTPTTSFLYYVSLRNGNPAPFSFYFAMAPLNLNVCSSSPEEFLSLCSLDQCEFELRMKPIKGTAPRDLGDPAHDETLKNYLLNSQKERSENLMIVDLIRNDLGRIAQPNSVQVPVLFGIESYQSVHQMVTTVTAKLDSEFDSLDCIEACFPPGSMTGAPKQRSVELLKEIEGEPRGIYSGVAGWISLSKCLDLNVIIRTVVFDDEKLEVGAGGAIVHLSDPADEFEEVMIKAFSVIKWYYEFHIFTKFIVFCQSLLWKSGSFDRKNNESNDHQSLIDNSAD